MSFSKNFIKTREIEDNEVDGLKAYPNTKKFYAATAIANAIRSRKAGMIYDLEAGLAKAKTEFRYKNYKFTVEASGDIATTLAVTLDINGKVVGNLIKRIERCPLEFDNTTRRWDDTKYRRDLKEMIVSMLMSIENKNDFWRNFLDD